MDIKGLILAGGASTRMGQPKALMELNGKKLYQQAVDNMSRHCSSISISLRPAQLPDFASHLLPSIEVLLDEEEDIGPASGLLAAYKSDQTAHWLVFACDFPLATSETFSQLIKSYKEPLTCFYNVMPEPLFGIWSPDALSQLKHNVEKGRNGPMSTLKQLLVDESGNMGEDNLILAEREEWLINCNTPDEWDKAIRLQSAR